jgi:dihydrofolate reductase
MRKLIESTFVTLGGDIGAPQDWGPPYLFGDDQDAYGRDLLFGADALLLGRRTYEGLSAAYPTMVSPGGGPMADFIDRMNAIPKYVASTTLRTVGWNATLLASDVVAQVADLKQQPGRYLLKYGTGLLTASWWRTGWSMSSGSGSCRSRTRPASDCSKTSRTRA